MNSLTIDNKEASKSAILGLKINHLIQMGVKYNNLSICKIKGYRDVIARHQQNMHKLSQKDTRRLRYNIRVLEIMIDKGKNENQSTLEELELIKNTLGFYREELNEGYEIEKHKTRLLQVINIFSRRILLLKNSKYLKAIQQAIQKKQSEQLKITVIKCINN